MLDQWDEVEMKMGKSVKLMEPNELLDYVEMTFRAKFGYDLPVEREREMSMFKRLKKTYGQDAGYILKWFFHKHEGVAVYRSGRTHKFKVSWLASSQKYWLDGLFEEVQAQRKKEREDLKREVGVKTDSEVESKKRGFTTASDFLNM